MVSFLIQALRGLPVQVAYATCSIDSTVAASFLLPDCDGIADLVTVLAQNPHLLRRLKIEELLTKVAQIEQQVELMLSDPRGHTIQRQRLVLAIARQIRSHLEDQLKGGPRTVAVIPDDEPAKLVATSKQSNQGPDLA